MILYYLRSSTSIPPSSSYSLLLPIMAFFHPILPSSSSCAPYPLPLLRIFLSFLPISCSCTTWTYYPHSYYCFSLYSSSLYLPSILLLSSSLSFHSHISSLPFHRHLSSYLILLFIFHLLFLLPQSLRLPRGLFLPRPILSQIYFRLPPPFVAILSSCPMFILLFLFLFLFHLPPFILYFPLVPSFLSFPS